MPVLRNLHHDVRERAGSTIPGLQDRHEGYQSSDPLLAEPTEYWPPPSRMDCRLQAQSQHNGR